MDARRGGKRVITRPGLGWPLFPVLSFVLLASLRIISDAAYIHHMATADGGAYRSVLAALFPRFF